MSRIDLVVFGASGFTGKYTVKEILKIVKRKTNNFTWGVAGRNKEKLTNVLLEMGKEEEIDCSKIPIIIADISDADSLKAMAKQAKVILNCCGPFRFYGEPVIQACIENKTHHVDVSGEPEYMETMQLKYHEKAKENGVYIISACGFDSIPADLGTVFHKKKFNGELNSLEIYLESWTSGIKMGGSSVHYGTWESAVHAVASMPYLNHLKEAFFPNTFPSVNPKLKFRFPIFKNDLLGGKWCLFFPGPDESVVKRSQYFFYKYGNERPVQVKTYFTFPNLIATLLIAFAAIVLGIFAKFSFGRQLLLKYPKLFSLNFASHEGPPEEKANNTFFSMTFFGEGWSEKLVEPDDKHMEAPNRKLVTKVTGRNPAYGATCICLIMSAITILEDSEKMPDRGGVYPPGAAFSETTMIERLTNEGVKFEICANE